VDELKPKPPIRYTLKRREILRGKRAFAYLFEHGHSFKMGVLKFYYVFDIPEELVQTQLTGAFSAPKRLHKRAVARNLLKRRMREAFRLHKEILLPGLQRNERRLVIFVTYSRPFIAKYDQIASGMKAGLHRLAKEVDKREADTDISG
jgi:ribonuclease P protein component